MIAGYREWMKAAACRFVPNPDIFFHRNADDLRLARAVCDTCPVIDRCAKELWNDPYAVVAGKTPRQRKYLDRASRNRLGSTP